MPEARAGYPSVMILVLVGLIFIGAAVAVGVDVWRENSAHVSVQAFGHAFSQPPWVVIVVGTVCGALIVLGLAMLLTGAAARRRLLVERRAAIRDRDRLAQQASAERAAREQAERERAAAQAEAQQMRLAAQSQPTADVTSRSGPV